MSELSVRIRKMAVDLGVNGTPELATLGVQLAHYATEVMRLEERNAALQRTCAQHVATIESLRQGTNDETASGS